MEIWKDIKGYEGLYQVSNLGNVRSLPRVVKQLGRYGRYHTQTRQGKVLKGVPNSKGYLRVMLKDKRHFIHRLVAEHFIPNPDNKPQVNHLDGDKLNNHYKNLEWVTNQENRNHALEHNLHRTTKGEQRKNSKLTETDVLWIRQNAIKRHKVYGYKPLAKKFNVAEQTIKNIIDRKKWKHI